MDQPRDGSVSPTESIASSVQGGLRKKKNVRYVASRYMAKPTTNPPRHPQPPIIDTDRPERPSIGFPRPGSVRRDLLGGRSGSALKSREKGTIDGLARRQTILGSEGSVRRQTIDPRYLRKPVVKSDGPGIGGIPNSADVKNDSRMTNGLSKESHSQPTVAPQNTNPPPQPHPASQHTATSHTSPSHSIPIEDELHFLRIRDLQWTYLRAKATHSFTEQRKKKEHQLYTLWTNVTTQQHILAQSQLSFRQEVEMDSHIENLKVQNECLDRIVDAMTQFRGLYEALGKTTRSTAVKLRVEGAVVLDPGELRDVLREGAGSVGDVGDGGGSIQEFGLVAKKLKSLCSIAKQEAEELGECNRLLKALAAEQVVEQSLVAQRVQMAS